MAAPGPAPPLRRACFLPLLLLLAAFSAAPTAAATRPSSTRKPAAFFPGVAPLHLQALKRQRASGSEFVAAAAADGSGTANGTGEKLFTAHYFAQELDHFTFTPNASMVFRQKYLLNDTFWRRPSAGGVAGPLFVYTGNEGDIEWFANNTGFMFDIAPKFGALLVFIEHRFYGESKPFGNDSYNSAEKLGYLTSTQALADFAILIRSLKKNLSAEAAPVVVFGGSYGGMLASWFRLKYPHVTIGAVASSAPILQFDYITPWSSFYDGVSQDFKSESFNCFSVIKATWDVLDERGSTDKGLLELSKLFKACKTVKYAYSIRNWLWTAFTYTAMVDYPTPANFLENLPAYPVKEMCKIIDGFSAGVDILEKALAAASLYYNYTGDQTCNKIEDGDDPHGLDGWQWQACTEMIMPMTISNDSMFPPSSFSYDEIAVENNLVVANQVLNVGMALTQLSGPDPAFVSRQNSHAADATRAWARFFSPEKFEWTRDFLSSSSSACLEDPMIGDGKEEDEPTQENRTPKVGKKRGSKAPILLSECDLDPAMLEEVAQKKGDRPKPIAKKRRTGQKEKQATGAEHEEDVAADAEKGEPEDKDGQASAGDAEEGA